MKRCYGCMQLKENSPLCEHCGFDEQHQNKKHQLPVGTVVGDQYVLGRVLGQGGFGITYLGWDRITEQTVAVKEYFPNGYAGRDTHDFTVTSYDDLDKDAFEQNKQRFLREAESLSKLWNIPQIVKILRCFEDNSTAYIAMEYVEGMDLRQHMKKLGRVMTIAETLSILGPVIEALDQVHRANLVHRDISPDNIMVLPDGNAKLLDFGAARYVENADAEKERNTSTQAILKHGFAPPEQYQSHGALGPWTDVYAICATMYYCLTGKIPPEAMSRMIEGKPLRWDTVPGLTDRQRSVLEKGMALAPKDRFASARELWDELGANKKKESGTQKARTATIQQPEKKPEANQKSTAKKKGAGNRGATNRIIIAIAAVLALLIGIGFFSIKKPAADKPAIQDPVPAATMDSAEETTVPTEPALEITSLLEFEDAQLGETVTLSILSGHNAEELTWSSDDPTVAFVSENGTVTATGYGMALVTAEYEGQAAVCTVYVDRTPNIVCTYEENETGLTITGYEENTPTEVILPRKIDGKPVTRIENDVFAYCSMESLYIPVGIEEIGYSAFQGCTSLTQLTIPRSVRSIENNVFYQTPWLANQKEEFVICGDGILLKYNGTESDVVIPSTVKQISNAFCDSPYRITSVTIPESVTCIGRYAFFSCSYLTGVVIPDSVTTIGGHAFRGCSSLRSITIPDGVASIEENTFHDCTNLEQIDLPESLRIIEARAFTNCSNLNHVILPYGVTTIVSDAFASCSSLTDITIPDTVTTIEFGAFNATPWLFNQQDPFVVCGDGVLIHYSGNDANVKIPSSVKIIGAAFEYNEAITSVSIPDSVVSIGRYAFQSCTNLESITIPGSVVSIGSSAFNGCSKLENVIIEDGVVTIGDGAFFDCYKLINIRIPNTVTSIGVQAFWRCLDLETITIPGSVESIGGSAFIHCNSLKSVTLENGVKSIGPDAFWKCALLKTVTIPDSVTHIGSRAFEQCTRLNRIHIPNGVTVIEDNTFWGCSQLESIVIPDGVTSIGNGAFHGCTKLKDVTIPVSVVSIGDQAFHNANQLKQVTISPNCTVGKDAFLGGCTVSYY